MREPLGMTETQGARPGPDRRGIVLVVAIMVVMLVALLGSALLTVSGTEHQIARNDQQVTQALYLAEAGVQTAMNDLNLGNPPTASGTLGPGEFTATVTAAAPPTAQLRIVAVGFVPSQAAPRAVRRLDVLVMRPTPFQFGAFGDTSLTMAGGSLSNSYDSQVAAYDPLTAGSNGDVGSNGNITLNGTPTTVSGDVVAGGTISTTGSVTVTGDSTQGAPPVETANVDCPPPGFTPGALIPPGPGVSYNQGTGNLQITAGANLVLSAPPSPPGYYYFSSVTLVGGSTLSIAPGTLHVDVFISQTLSITAGTIVNTSAQPTQLSIWGCGTSTTNWTLTGGSGSYFAVYAPNHQVNISGNADIWGSVVGNEINVGGGARVHYDEALGRLRGNPNKYAVQPWSWTELIP